MADDFALINLDKWDIADKLIAEGIAEATAALAFAIEDQARENIRTQEAIDTGALLNSVYTETINTSAREFAISQAISFGQNQGSKTGRPHKETLIARAGRRKLDELDARVAVAVNYGLYVEMGVTGAFGVEGRDIAPRPFLIPAAEEIRAKADNIAAKFIADKLKNA